MGIFRQLPGLLLLFFVCCCHLSFGVKISKSRKTAMFELSGVTDGTQQFFSSCEQSSNEEFCGMAHDGDASSEWSQCSTTNVLGEVKPWWRGYLENPTYVATVAIVNVEWKRVGETDALTDFTISGSGYICHTHAETASFSSMTFPCDVLASDVEIKSSIVASVLALCEVTVIGSPLKFSTILGPPVRVLFEDCRQSTTNASRRCWNAIDDYTRTKNIEHCTQTKPQSYPWWNGILKVPAIVQRVVIYSPDCCQNSLTNFVVIVGSQHCARYESLTPFQSKQFLCNQFGGNVRIQLMGHAAQMLSICEVLVYAHPVDLLPEHKRNTHGCFKDGDDGPVLAMDSMVPVSVTAMTTLKCDRMCRRFKANYFGLRAGGECWCSRNFGNHSSAANEQCGMPCEGHQKQYCGNHDHTLVYELLWHN